MIEACNFNMTNQRYISQIRSQLASINKSFYTIDYHTTGGDNSRARLEMEYNMSLITELYARQLNLENIGRQPEEILPINNIKNYYDHILVISS